MRRISWLGLASGVASAILCFAVSGLPVCRGLERWLFDGNFIWRGVRNSKIDIVIVAIDDRSLRKLHKPLIDISPELAKVVTYVDAEGARAIGIDLIIPDDLEGRREFKRGEDGDTTKLGEAIANSGKVVLPQWNT